jgi:hypothetical protein
VLNPSSPFARVVRLSQLAFEPRPVHLPSHLHQRVARNHKPVQLDSEQFSLHLVDDGFWLHRFSPIFGDVVELNQENGTPP